ncbi:hypothetical protein BDV96DRAFT_642114 [Lophiotrema nucula]|uniref:CmcJ-like methyltransferase n=1 Tax=Lophiotrema nucula TaxID=690887 RepID=A0A6A5ZKZ5_9PLEO|nr:hypothetical protein BDV96DRAFT_642114 [Lophiotrema nucula]
MGNESSPTGLEVTLTFVDRESVVPGEKLYGLDYEAPHGFPPKNFDTEGVQVTLHDIRPFKTKLSLDKEGFCILDLQSKMEYSDFFIRDKVQSIFAEELREAVRKLLGARGVYLHECVLRKREPTYGTPEASNPVGQPIPTAHADYTKAEIIRIIERLSGYTDVSTMTRVQALNIWKPLRGPLNDWPLAVCDMSSIDPENDLSKSDSVSPDGVVEAYVAHYNPNQRWYYLSEHMPSELLVFRAADLEKGGTVPHCAFYNPACPTNEEPRESIEFRVIAVY